MAALFSEEPATSGNNRVMPGFTQPCKLTTLLAPR